MDTNESTKDAEILDAELAYLKSDQAVDAESGRLFPADFLFRLAEKASEVVHEWMKANAPQNIQEAIEDLNMIHIYSTKAADGCLTDWDAADLLTMVPRITSEIKELGGSF